MSLSCGTGRIVDQRHGAQCQRRSVAWLDGKPISIGVSGKWGVGKSSMIRLIRRGLAERTKTRAEEFVFVEFNAWLYQGYDDARAALLEVIASTLAAEAAKRETGIEKAQ